MREHRERETLLFSNYSRAASASVGRYGVKTRTNN
jgi:hypothetical protein